MLNEAALEAATAHENSAAYGRRAPTLVSRDGHMAIAHADKGAVQRFQPRLSSGARAFEELAMPPDLTELLALAGVDAMRGGGGGGGGGARGAAASAGLAVPIAALDDAAVDTGSYVDVGAAGGSGLDIGLLGRGSPMAEALLAGEGEGADGDLFDWGWLAGNALDAGGSGAAGGSSHSLDFTFGADLDDPLLQGAAGEAGAAGAGAVPSIAALTPAEIQAFGEELMSVDATPIAARGASSPTPGL
jgi:hypothetical protein